MGFLDGRWRGSAQDGAPHHRITEFPYLQDCVLLALGALATTIGHKIGFLDLEALFLKRQHDNMPNRRPLIESRPAQRIHKIAWQFDRKLFCLLAELSGWLGGRMAA